MNSFIKFVENFKLFYFMKKLLLLSTVAVTLFATSCKKDKTCQCTYSSSVPSEYKAIIDSTAKVYGTNSTNCSALSTGLSAAYSGSSCSLK